MKGGYKPFTIEVTWAQGNQTQKETYYIEAVSKHQALFFAGIEFRDQNPDLITAAYNFKVRA